MIKRIIFLSSVFLASALFAVEPIDPKNAAAKPIEDKIAKPVEATNVQDKVKKPVAPQNIQEKLVKPTQPKVLDPKEAQSKIVKSQEPTKGVNKVLNQVNTKANEVKPMSTNKEPVVEIKTNLGAIRVKLYPEKAPTTVQNFLGYVDKKFYDQTVFHRVIDNFMVQGGGFAKTPDGIMQKSTDKPIKIESKNGLKNKRGSIAMARTNDPNSATSQFFINVNDNGFLDYPGQDGHGYTVFGEVVDKESMLVVDKIKAEKTGMRQVMFSSDPKGPKGPMPDVPVKDVVIESVKLM